MSANIMFKTKFWSDRKNLMRFTPEDKYFYVWCLTNEHIDILGHCEISEQQIALELGYSNYQNSIIDNLIDRFANKYGLILWDNETGELLVKHFYKYNWNTSSTVKKMIDKAIKTVRSSKLISFIETAIAETQNKLSIESRIETETQCDDNNTPCSQSVDTPISINKSINNIVSIDTINEYFEKTYLLYPRKVSKEDARNAYEHKFRKLEIEEARKLANYIYRCLERQIEAWKAEKGGNGRDREHTPYMATWLNDNFADSPKFKGGKKK